MAISEIEEQIVKEILQDLAENTLILPSLPDVVLKVREEIENEDVTSSKIAAVIKTDAALSTRLIQVANSPLMRGKREIDSVGMAVTRMGNTMVKNVVTSLIVQQIFQPTTEVTEKRMRGFWEHNSQVAAISQALAPMAKLKPDQALLAGLVHDIGALPILKRAEDIPQLLENEELLDSILVRTHGDIGTAMLKKWDFPSSLVNVPLLHEKLDRRHDGPADYVDVVTVANLQSYLDSEHRLAAVEWASVPAFVQLGLETDVNLVAMEGGDDIKGVQEALLL